MDLALHLRVWRLVLTGMVATTLATLVSMSAWRDAPVKKRKKSRAARRCSARRGELDLGAAGVGEADLGVAVAAVFLLGFEADAGFFEGQEVAPELGATDAVGFLDVHEADADAATLELVEDADEADGLVVGALLAGHLGYPVL